MAQKSTKFNINKELKNTQKCINRLDKSPTKYTKKDWAIFVGGFLFFGGLATKLLNIQQWYADDFYISSYNPYSIIIYIPSSLAFVWYAIYKKDPLLTAIGIVGVIYTLLLAFGVAKTYFPIEPII